MQVCDVKELLKSSSEDPYFFINFHNIGRGLVGDSTNNESQAYIKKTKILTCWKIIGEKLQRNEHNREVLFDRETYIFQWTFELVTNGTTNEDTLFFYWKGINASKGYSPLPPEIEEQNPAVERICQWSEPALFFHIFAKPLVVLNGSHEKFNPKEKRLFIARGELPSEIHLYEIPCLKENLRSKGVFILLDPTEDIIYYWYGSAVPNKYRQLIRNEIKLNERNEEWKNYKTIEIKEEDDEDMFFASLSCQSGNYVTYPQCINFTPSLFYLNSITGDFLATEVEYPLRSRQQNAAFPFLQSHLYTADQPALFLLDNEDEVWLWEGWKTADCNVDSYEKELELAKVFVNNYAKEKGWNHPIPVKHVVAGSEPLEFTNIFPYWKKE